MIAKILPYPSLSKRQLLLVLFMVHNVHQRASQKRIRYVASLVFYNLTKILARFSCPSTWHLCSYLSWWKRESSVTVSVIVTVVVYEQFKSSKLVYHVPVTVCVWLTFYSYHLFCSSSLFISWTMCSNVSWQCAEYTSSYSQQLIRYERAIIHHICRFVFFW